MNFLQPSDCGFRFLDAPCFNIHRVLLFQVLQRELVDFEAHENKYFHAWQGRKRMTLLKQASLSITTALPVRGLLFSMCQRTNERLRCLGWLPKKPVQEPRCSKVVNPQPIVQHGVKVVKRVNSS